ncbi:hypothetical protein KM043_010825 [Ampulex compressa]|nr:hypothetical protein KM043_010825 [Ampulex compressa]
MFSSPRNPLYSAALGPNKEVIGFRCSAAQEGAVKIGPRTPTAAVREETIRDKQAPEEDSIEGQMTRISQFKFRAVEVSSRLNSGGLPFEIHVPWER